MHLIEDAEVSEALDDALLKWVGTMVAWEAATWVILHDPGIGVAMTESGNVRAFTYEGAKSIQQPTITLIYELAGLETTIRAALFAEPNYAQAGRA